MPLKTILRYRCVIARLFIAGSLLLASHSASAEPLTLPITFHRQEHALSCEIASLKTALHTLGIDVTESELIAQLPFDSTAKTAGVWGNPYHAFVGSIDGQMMRTGYGVYWDPIATLGAKYARTRVLRHSSAQQLAASIAAGNPVIIWGYYGAGTPYSWRTPAGVAVAAVDGEHTRVVYGFDGPAQAPTAFYLMDPLAGALVWSTEQLMANTSRLNHMAVAVAPRWVRLPGDTKVWEVSADGTTRHWVTSWAAFTRRGGTTATITVIDAAKLSRYSIGPSIE